MPLLTTAGTPKIGLHSPMRSLSILRFHSYFMAISLLFYFLLPLPILLILGWHYIGGGPALENIHPATYLLFAGLSFSLVIDPLFRSQVVARAATDLSLVAFLAAVVITVLYCYFVHDVSAAPFVDTFFAAIVGVIVLSCMPVASLRFLRRLIDIFFAVNIVMIFWETERRKCDCSECSTGSDATAARIGIIVPVQRGSAKGTEQHCLCCDLSRGQG
jgi:hypothetical protein